MFHLEAHIDILPYSDMRPPCMVPNDSDLGRIAHYVQAKRRKHFVFVWAMLVSIVVLGAE